MRFPRALLRRTRPVVVLLLAVLVAVPAFCSLTRADAATVGLPCDAYAAGGTPCEAAFSTTRAMFASYGGPLYQIQRASDGVTLNIGLKSTGGVANAAPQVSFCSGTRCTVTVLYDQTANGNNMPISPGTSCPGCSKGIPGPGPNGSDIGANAMALPVTVGGQPAYGVLFDAQGIGYRNNNAKNVPTGSQPTGVYMLTSSNVTSGGCCFDFGSGEADDTDDGDATMNAIYYGTDCWTKNCNGPGPWVGGDLENGMFFSDTGANPSNIPSEKGTFVSAWEKNNGTTNFTLKYGNGQSGGLAQSYSGALPPGYNPMKVQNSIELGTGGDNSVWGNGEFFEGAVTAGFPSDATENAVQAGIVAAGYQFKISGQPFGGTPAPVPGLVQAANYDTGGQGQGFNVNSIQGNSGYRSDAADLETTSDPQNNTGAGGGFDIGWTGTGQWFDYTVNVAAAGTYTVSLRAASPSGVTDAVHLTDNTGGDISGPVNVPATGGFQTWTTVTTTVPLAAGVQTLRVCLDNGGWNLHFLSLATGSSGGQPLGGTPAAIPGTVQAANYDNGGQGVGYSVNGVNGGANSYRLDGVDLENTGDTQGTTGTGAAYNLGWTGAGQWFTYTVTVATAGTYTVNLRLASPNGVTDALHIADSSGTNLSGNVNAPASGGWQTWTTVTTHVTLPAGTQTLTLYQDNGGWNIHNLTFAN